MTRKPSLPGVMGHKTAPSVLQSYPKLGRPVSTGSSTTKPIAFRVSGARRAALEERGQRVGISADLLVAYVVEQYGKEHGWELPK